MTVYSIKIALRGISPMNWRRLRLPGSTSIADFHHIIQIAMGWDNDYLHCFHIFGALEPVPISHPSLPYNSLRREPSTPPCLNFLPQSPLSSP